MRGTAASAAAPAAKRRNSRRGNVISYLFEGFTNICRPSKVTEMEELG
jgi:hypothetical protein